MNRDITKFRGTNVAGGGQLTRGAIRDSDPLNSGRKGIMKNRVLEQQVYHDRNCIYVDLSGSHGIYTERGGPNQSP